MKINLYKSITVAAAASFLFLLPAPAGAAEGLSGFQIPDSFSGGSGTLDDPYLIADAGQLALLSSLSNSEDYETRLSYSKASYLLTADIQLNDVSDFSEWENAAPENVWRAIGENGHFDGVFDGKPRFAGGLIAYAGKNCTVASCESSVVIQAGPDVTAICGLYLFDDADDEAVTYLRNCSWSGPSPAGYYAAIYETGIEDVGPQA